ncbi:MAG TPA: DUF3011 domain-containing protein [Bryobacteraceae bacterium]|jgi:hypothetical protein|nr:DUF3011 domain-containing protein [Bryobacteraceae bacterium]
MPINGIVIRAVAFGIVASSTLLAETVTCSSDDGGRHHCAIAPDYTRVRMVHQRSGSPCEEGRSWGTDDRGIWVDHGCRADFDVDRSSYGASGGSPSETITCSSDNGGRNYCRIAPNYTRVRMVHQRSGSRCEEGYSWGTNDHGLWVDHGCRADFVVERGNYGNADYGTINNPNHGAGDYQGREKVVTCADESGHGNHCNAIVAGGVEMVRQRSDAKCVKGYSWGTDEQGIWVDHGCRADFVLHGVAADR